MNVITKVGRWHKYLVKRCFSSQSVSCTWKSDTWYTFLAKINEMSILCLSVWAVCILMDVPGRRGLCWERLFIVDQHFVINFRRRRIVRSVIHTKGQSKLYKSFDAYICRVTWWLQKRSIIWSRGFHIHKGFLSAQLIPVKK